MKVMQKNPNSVLLGVVILVLTLFSHAPAQAATLSSIDVAPINPTINVGQTQAFTATGTFSDATTQILRTSVKAIAAGSAHSCALLSDGTVQCWGLNAGGQLGNGTSTGPQLCDAASYVCSTTPIFVIGINTAVAIAAGAAHTCALLKDGTVQCWGNNAYGQLGNNSTSDSLSPVSVSGIDSVTVKATAIAAGGNHTCALLSIGQVQCWGDNRWGDLGNGTTTQSSTPVTVSGIATAKAIAAMDANSCALLSDGTLQCWGPNDDGELGNGTNTGPQLCDSFGAACSTLPIQVSGINTATAVAIGSNYACALLGDGTVQCWGNGPLGNDTTGWSTTPITVSGISTAIALGAGGSHACALLASGIVQCWGGSGNGEVGNGTTASSTIPTTVIGVNSAKALATGVFHTCVLLDNGAVQCWGANTDGQLGIGRADASSNTPVPVIGISTAAAVAAGDNNSCALIVDKSVQCWGAFSAPSLIPIGVSGISTATALAAGGAHICALLASGQVQCWGGGLLGDGTTTSSTIPVTVSGVNTAKALAAGISHTCALLDNGTVQCWGTNAYGQLGNNSTSNSPTPVSVSGIDGVTVKATAIAAGGYHTCALLASGQVQCWGDNVYGDLGNGTATQSTIPVTVGGISTATTIAVGYKHSCALLSDGTVQCWGYNIFGELGNGNTAIGASWTPVTVSGISTAMTVAAGGDSSCALLSSGAVQCWGDNTWGHLGNGSFAKSYIPVTVIGIGNATAIAVGHYHDCALLSDRTIRCWGLNYYGQLGDGGADQLGIGNGRGLYSIPVSVIGISGSDGTGSIVWSSSDTDVGTIDANGLVTGRGPGTTTITATVGSISGSTGLTVAGDTTVLSITAPANITVEATSAAGAVVIYLPCTATDNIDPAPTISYSKSSGTIFPLGTSNVQCTATDSSGNSSSTGFMVTVQDTTPPAITAPPAVDAEATSNGGAVVNYPPCAAADNVGALPTISYSQPPGTTFPVGTTTVQCTAADSAGNTSTSSFTVTVHDSKAPTFTYLPNVTVTASSAAGAIVNYPQPTVTDLVDPAPSISYSQASGTIFPIGTTTVTVTATDFSGNSSIATFKVIVTLLDSTPPSDTQDTDGDGLTDIDEIFVYDTDMYEADTDGDGISDGAEVAANTDPLVSGSGTPPPAPTSLSGTVANGRFVLSWMADQAAEGWYVYMRPAGTNAAFSRINSSPVTNTTFQVNKSADGQPLVADATYEFAVSTLQRGLEGPQSASIKLQFVAGNSALSKPAHPILFLHGFISNAKTWDSVKDYLISVGWKFGGELVWNNGVLELENQPSDGSRGDFYIANFKQCLNANSLSADAIGAVAALGESGSLCGFESIEEQGKEVKEFLDTIAAQQFAGQLPQPQFTIVAHSMGGLAARAYLTDPNNLPPSNVTRLVIYGTPNTGTYLSQIADLWGAPEGDTCGVAVNSLKLDLAVGTLLKYGLGQGLAKILLQKFNGIALLWSLNKSAPSLFEMGVGSSFLSGLNLRFVPDYIQYRILVGQPQSGVKEFFNKLSYYFMSAGCGSYVTALSNFDQSDVAVTYPSQLGLGPNQEPYYIFPISKLSATQKYHWEETSDVLNIINAIGYNTLEFSVHSPVEIEITTPDGLKISKDFDNIPGAFYSESQYANGDAVAKFSIPFPKAGEYSIHVTPKSGALPTDTYTINMTQGNTTTVLANDQKVSDIPPQPVKVTVELDTNAPIVTPPANISAPATSTDGAVVTYPACTATDNLDPTPSISYSPPSGTTFPVGTTTVVCTAMDSAGNSSTASFTVTVQDITGPVLPDLIVSNVSTGILNIKRNAGGNFNVNDTVENLGGAQAGKFVVAYHLSTDMIYGNGDDVVSATTRKVIYLATGASNTWNPTAVYIPTTTPPGIYHLCEKADDDVDGIYAVAELNEDNNWACTATTIEVPKPDLYISQVSIFTYSMNAGGTMAVLDSLTNKGGSQALTFEIGYVLSSNSVIGDGDDIPVGSRALTSLGVGATSTASTHVTIPASVPPGSYYVGAIADLIGAVDELNEANNTKRASSKITVNP